ncbi:thioredoxin family protein [Aureivirga marina]|uniref:thioredoxin family protein n=1 Tax=Aureivirga marina TaxID=1182451 RepID=UPI0018CA7C7D|nr:thioredoxin fold domain-containing protein [Aureivirga marina]
MKKTILLMFVMMLSGFTFAQQAEINWMTLEEAVEAQKKEPRKIIMDAYTVWCGPCKMLDKNTFHNPDVVAYVNKHFYAVKFNAEGNETVKFKGKTFTNPGYQASRKNSRNSSHQLSQAFGIRAYPTLIYLDENANLIAPVPGYQTPQNIELYLKLFATDKYKEFKSQEDFVNYQSSFVATFK